MYVLEHRKPQAAGVRQRNRWRVYAFCGSAGLLEKVRSSLPDARNWRIRQTAGSCEDALLRREARTYRKAG